METQFQPKVDVLIPVYKPDRRFGRLLQMLKEQTYQVNRIIVIIFLRQSLTMELQGIWQHGILRQR